MTAPQASSLALAESARTVQLRIRAALLQDVAKLWPMLDVKRLDESFPGWLRAMSLLVTNYHGQSAAAASRFYRSARTQALESPTPSALVKLAPPPATDWLDRAFGYSGPGMLHQDVTRPNTALSVTLGTASRIVLDGGRTTILDSVQRDPASVGWYRTSDHMPCAFCALLIARGVVYKHDTAGFKTHNHCACYAAPAFRDGPPLPEITKTAQRIYRERGKGPALPAFRKAWAEHQAAA